MSDQSIVGVTQADRQRIPGSIPRAATVWRDAYVAVYGCEPTHAVSDYQGAYDVIERAMSAIDAASMGARIAEREACAKVAEDQKAVVLRQAPIAGQAHNEACDRIAAAIRARSDRVGEPK